MIFKDSTVKINRMLALAKPIHIQKTPKLPVNKVRFRRPIRSTTRSALPSQDLVNYAEFQLVTWVLPMVIAGRLLKVEYPSLLIGLCVMTAAKLSLAANGIIQY
jgi:hypothetical protein